VPRFYNIDHSPASVENGPAVAPGDAYDFTDEQVAVGIAGLWSEHDPRGGARQQPAFEQAHDEQTTDPAEPEDKEQQA
jgi:hypothetical protein